MSKLTAENITIDKALTTFTTIKYKTIKYKFVAGRDIVCPKCGAINNIKIEPIEKKVNLATCYCGNCDFKKEIIVEYLDAEIKASVANGKLK